jgi:hypothetical protein
MNDPHVKALHYRVIVGKDIDYNNAPPVSEITDEFDLSIDGDTAIFEMKKHYSTADEAKEVGDEYLRAWDILIGLEHDPDDLRFIFDRADVINRSPYKTGKNVVNLQAHVAITATCDVILHASRGRYPSFPKNFIASTDAETMYFRYKTYRQNREKLTSMAYMCLTVLEGRAAERDKAKGKKREMAAKQYCIDIDVLDTLGKLCTVQGDTTEARKYSESGTFTPLNPKEKEWIVSVIKILIHRVGEYEYAHSNRAKLKQITMGDFPKI